MADSPAQRRESAPDPAFNGLFQQNPPRPFITPAALVTRLRLNRLTVGPRESYEAWQQAQLDEASLLVPSEFSGKDGKREKVSKPTAREAVIASGIVSASPAYNDALRGVDRRVALLETEAVAMFEVAESAQVPAVNLRGVSDYAGADKAKFEQETSNKARVIAARNVMSFFASQVETARFKEFLTTRRTQSTERQAELRLPASASVDTILNVIESQRCSFDERLRSVAVGYELLQKGYRLPVPRVRVSDTKTGAVNTRPENAVEIRDALREARVLTIAVPQDYPDQSLSWIIASDLISAELNGRQIIPVVIKSEDIQRPRKGIRSNVPPEILVLEKSVFARIVVIIDDFKYERSTVADFLIEEIGSNPDLHIVVVSRSETNALVESRFISRALATEAHLCEVSFSELSSFVRTNFEMPSQASEVIALRLQQVFRRFRMPSHPAYFAGISRNVLAAILRANRRADLIELAVTGYLTYAVSGDPEKITLSRRAREVFLTDLVYDMRIKGESPTESELVRRAEILAAKKDFDIRPTQFVAWFQEHGIIHYYDNVVRFTLPFVESFLLAKKLASDPASAITYFALDQLEFDHSAFALYSEIGATDDLLDALKGRLDDSITALSKADDSWLSTGKIKSSLLARQSRVEKMQKGLQSAINDIREDKDVSKEKQRLLDAVDRVRGSVEERRASLPVPDQQSVEMRAMHVWSVAATLLGSGAEALDAKVKRDVADKLIKLTGLIIEDWSRLNSRLDFELLRAELLRDKDFLSSLSDSASKADLRDAERLVDSMVDVIEFTILSEPFRQMSNRLCSEAHDIVLAQSIANIKQSAPLDELIRSLWLADLDAQRGKSALSDSIRLLKWARLLRIGLTHHLVWRVFWDVPNRADRLVLLDLADASMRVIGRSLATNQLDELAEKASAVQGGG